MLTNPTTNILLHGIFRDGSSLSSGTCSATHKATRWDDDEGSDDGSELVEEYWDGCSPAHDGRAAG
jgi:hypothetical protein